MDLYSKYIDRRMMKGVVVNLNIFIPFQFTDIANADIFNRKLDLALTPDPGRRQTKGDRIWNPELDSLLFCIL